MQQCQKRHLTGTLQDKEHWLYQSYQFGVLSGHAIGILDQSLELIVLSESDDLQHGAKL